MQLILKNPKHAEFKDVVAYLGSDFDTNYFDKAATNKALKKYDKLCQR